MPHEHSELYNAYWEDGACGRRNRRISITNRRFSGELFRTLVCKSTGACLWMCTRACRLVNSKTKLTANLLKSALPRL